MTEFQEEMEPTEEELDAGFSSQTLSYPEDYELPNLETGEGRRLERTVALSVDSGCRFRRRRTGEGYVLETLETDEWTIVAEFDSLDAVLASDRYGHWKFEGELEEDPMEEDDEDDV